MRLLISILLLSCCISCTAQRKSTSTEILPKKIEKQKQEADQLSRIGEYKSALKVYDKLIDKSDAKTLLLGRAQLHGYMGNYPDKMADLLEVQALDSRAKPSLLYELGMCSLKMEKHKESQQYLTQYLALDSKAARSQKNARRALKNINFILTESKAYEGLTLHPLGDGVNTPDLEYLPSINAEEDFLVFTRRVQGQEDLYFSEIDTNGQWLEAEAIWNINTSSNESGHCLSADGKTIILTKCDPISSIGSCDLFISRHGENQWSVPINMGDQINTQGWEGQPSLSANGRYLIFSSSREGGYGAKDLWICKKDSSGIWSQPSNLGPRINQEGNEGTPYLHPDGVTLYFRSDYLPGYGGYDLFLSRLDPDGWSKPQNLGKPINTSGDEGSLVVNLDGSHAFYASERKKNDSSNSKGDIDIFSFELPGELRAAPVTFVRLRTVDAETKMPIQTEIKLHAFAKKKAFLIKSTDESGELMICLPLGSDYALSVQKESYTYYNRTFQLLESRFDVDPIEILVNLEKLVDIEASEEPVVLNNVRFASGSADLLTASYLELDGLVELLKSRPELSIEIRGHTDNVGTEEDNLTLSQERATAVSDYLESNGVASQRLSATGYGESKPVSNNDSESGRLQNRRVEFVIR